MIENETVASERIKAAAKILKEIRPEYESILDFFEKLFLAQEEVKSRIDLDPPVIPDEILAVKRKEHFPLIAMNEFSVDREAARELFRTVWRLVGESRAQMSYMALDIDKAISNGVLDPEKLIGALLEGDDAFLEMTAGELKVDKQVLGFLTYAVIKPSVELGAEQLAGYLDPESEWPRGVCPVCGNYPGFATLEGDGGRLHFFCSFCWHKWPSQRLFCPFCETRDSSGSRYFYSETEPEYRVYVCDKCKKYVKTLDLRALARPVYPPLETIAALHLDMKAKEDGLESPPFGF
jgi:FdhE protein